MQQLKVVARPTSYERVSIQSLVVNSVRSCLAHSMPQLTVMKEKIEILINGDSFSGTLHKGPVETDPELTGQLREHYELITDKPVKLDAKAPLPKAELRIGKKIIPGELENIPKEPDFSIVFFMSTSE